MVFEESVKSSDFGIFLLEMINNSNDLKNNLDDYVFIFDHCPTHHAKCLQDLF